MAHLGIAPIVRELFLFIDFLCFFFCNIILAILGLSSVEVEALTSQIWVDIFLTGILFILAQFEFASYKDEQEHL